MTRPRLLFATLLPPYLGLHFEDQILRKLVEEYVGGFSKMYDLRLLLASAHPDVLDEARAIVGPSGVPVEYLHVPFVMQDHFSVRRGHEIAFGKQYLLRHLRPETFDYLMYIDSDIYISFADYDRLIRLLRGPRQFVSIPYVLHRTHRCGRMQFGAYIHSAELLTTIDYSAPVYRPFERDGKLCLAGADDCAARMCLMRRGGREIRAVGRVVSIATRHYSGNGTYGLYDAGHITRHWNAEGWLGFDPVISPAVMSLECCAALTNFARSVGARSAIVLGTDSGNAIGSLAAAGVEEMIVCDDSAAASHPTRQVCEKFKQAAISFRHHLTSGNGTGREGLHDLRHRRFDLAVFDEPANNSEHHIAAATQVDAAHYVFHNGERDAEAIRQFVQGKRLQGLPCHAARTTMGQGLAFVSVTEATCELDAVPSLPAIAGNAARVHQRR